ncbi:hypothetical protein [Staphylococcus haemolyticus]|uniref:hypothetical protein n=1 Tax=Staphylococcus haemolyticus TaxID=1283 RepID=UPI0011A2E8F4|nr:hypothetical protein [Staphylococcus haemolyticus]
MLSKTLENMSNDLSTEHNINNYLDEVPKENKLEFFDTAINELNEYVTAKTQRITKLFSSIFIVAMLIAIASMLFYQPLIQNEFQKQNMVDEKRIDIETKKANDDNTLANLNNLQSDLQDKTQNMYSNAGILFTTLVFGLLMSLVAFIIPAIVLSFSKVTLKKYRVLLAELQEQKYIYLSTNK